MVEHSEKPKRNMVKGFGWPSWVAQGHGPNLRRNQPLLVMASGSQYRWPNWHGAVVPTALICRHGYPLWTRALVVGQGSTRMSCGKNHAINYKPPSFLGRVLIPISSDLGNGLWNCFNHITSICRWVPWHSSEDNGVSSLGGTPTNRWFLKVHWNGWFGGTPSLGNLHIMKL